MNMTINAAVINTAPSQSQAPVNAAAPAANGNTDQSTAASTAGATSPSRTQKQDNSQNSGQTAAKQSNTAQPAKQPQTTQPTTAAAAAHVPVATPAADQGAGTVQSIFAQLLGQASANDATADATAKPASKGDKVSADGADSTAASLPGMAAPLLAPAVAPAPTTAAAGAAASQASAATTATAATTAATSAVAAAAAATMMNPAAALNAQAMSAQSQLLVRAAAGDTGSTQNGTDAGQTYQTYDKAMASATLNSRAAVGGVALAAATPGAAAPSMPVVALSTGTAPQGDGSAPAVTTAHVAAAVAASDPAPAAPSADASAAAAMAVTSAAAPAPSASDALTLSGQPQQWQQPLQQALGDRLQTQISTNSQQATIRLDPPNLGSIEIAISHSGGALQVNMSASNSDVLRQLHTIGDSVRQDLSSRQYTDVAVTVTATPRSAASQAFADGGDRQRQQQDAEDNTPGNALYEAGKDNAGTTFAMNDRE